MDNEEYSVSGEVSDMKKNWQVCLGGWSTPDAINQTRLRVCSARTLTRV